MVDYGKVDWNGFKNYLLDGGFTDKDITDIFNNDSDGNLSDGYDPINPDIMTKEGFDELVDDFTSTHQEHLNGSQDYVIK
jgi:hypothetical protein